MQNVTPIIFADDTSILITRQDTKELQEDLTLTFNQVSEWFKQNSLSLNINKTYFTHFHSKSVAYSDINIIYENNHITKVNNLKFLGLSGNFMVGMTKFVVTTRPLQFTLCIVIRFLQHCL